MPAETHTTSEPVSAEEVLALACATLAEILGIAEEAITRASRFADDLGADAGAVLELVGALEEDLGERTVGLSVDDEDLADLLTVGDVVDHVVARLGGAAA